MCAARALYRGGARYGESEQQLGSVFKAAEALGGAIIFLDELDALGGNRDVSLGFFLLMRSLAKHRRDTSWIWARKQQLRRFLDELEALGGTRT